MPEVQRIHYPIIEIGAETAPPSNGEPAAQVYELRPRSSGVPTMHGYSVPASDPYRVGAHSNGDPAPHYEEQPAEPHPAALMLYEAPLPAGEGLVTWQRPPVEVQDEPLPMKLDPRFVLLREPGSGRAKCFRVLRHRIASQGDPRIIGVASALPGEGKTTCALNLALAIAEEASAKVLLVEVNLSTPIFTKLFEYRPIECFADQVGRPSGALRPWIVAGFPQARLHVAAVDPSAGSRSRLDRALLGAALQELSQAYDYIVIDTAAALHAAEANLVAEHADGIVLVARARASRRRDVRRALDQLSPANVLGMCLLDSKRAEA